MGNAQELEAQRQRLGLKAETSSRVVHQNALNNPPWVVNENPGVEEIAPPHCQLLAPRGVKYTVTSTMIQLLNLKGTFRGVAGDDANQHLMNFMAICKSQEITGDLKCPKKDFPGMILSRIERVADER
ncbi:hypothetical protein KY290_017172 [Solanum tuberosum]|uniref:Uncharacterized protein n=1 Tax=Solanum tuberosum TaxID=4113 RepID=A0ABQ7VAJ1_SOLTU|nr:hypothetical protein KY284_016203 [Solanum tuberosum]KAH0761099.1 hypothetical protein KY290_017172 [Solanum tuberosum]